VAVVLPHKRFGTWINMTFLGEAGLTREQYNDYIALAATVILIIGCLFIYTGLRKNDHWKKAIFYLIVSIGLAVITLNTLFVINIEVVHFPQYAFFALLIFPLVKRYQSALIWATLAGIIDEAYQYFYLAPNDTGYYDFNDVLTNLVGASFGLIILKSFSVMNPTPPSFLHRSEIRAFFVMVLLIAVLFLVGILGIHISDGVQYPIIKKQITSFWTTIPPKITYHVVRPWEGLVVTVLLWFFYWPLGRDRSQRFALDTDGHNIGTK
tara:strand:- start:1733 stop:2530 length:798 start_codon:yes stop_codon:yes gene_type:complete